MPNISTPSLKGTPSGSAPSLTKSWHGFRTKGTKEKGNRNNTFSWCREAAERRRERKADGGNYQA